MIKRFSVAVAFIFASALTHAQVDYPKQYQNAKDLFRQGKYNLAMETFKPLITYDQKNQYSPYASFYYALAAYKQGYRAVAKDMLLQVRSVHPKWDKMEEVDLWLAKIYMEDKDYFQGIKTLNAIEDKKLDDAKETMKAEYISSIQDAETLKMMHEEFPRDEVVAKYLAVALSKNISDAENKKTLETLIERFKLERKDFIPEAPKTVFKDQYAVALLLPFMLGELDASPGKKRNQIVLDFYEGIKLALDSLNKEGSTIEVRAYDTEEGLNTLRQLLQSQELGNTDLIIGALSAKENTLVQEFSVNNQVNVFNPFSNNSDVIGENPFAYLFQPSAETLGSKAAGYIADHARKNVSMVFSGTSKKDSVLAASFAQKAQELGIKVVVNKTFAKEDAAQIVNILATATEYDEFKFPSQFTLPKDSIGSIFVASDDPLIYTKVISAIETRGDSILVVGSENWIDDTAVAFEKYQTLNVSFAAPNFVSILDRKRQRFISKYLSSYGKVPSNVAQLGYEMMIFVGNQLKTNGVYFQDALNKAEVIPGYFFQGFNYQLSRDNQLVPFVKFKNGVLTLVETR